jgi:ELP3 family radical SAM enzyme/protein acetyltransferase
MDIEDIGKPYNLIDEPIKFTNIINEMLEENFVTKEEMINFLNLMRRKYKISFSRQMILFHYRQYIKINNLEYDKKYNYLLRSKIGKSLSGIISITVFTSAYPKSGEKIEAFSCAFNCSYCPNEPNQPRSYLKQEPGVLRANRNNFDCYDQITDRARALYINGHPLDKIEILVLGGTWSSYPYDYQEEFIRDIYYSANVFQKQNRERLSLNEEMLINEDTECKIIGLTLETRPDQINKRELERFRRFGVTRVQLGVQHTNDRVLQRINRKCSIKKVYSAVKILKDSCFKIDMHFMYDLPTPLKLTVNPFKKDLELDDIDNNINMINEDMQMSHEILNNPNLQADQLKIYPTATTPFTKIKDEYEKGLYTPYGGSGNILFNIILKLMEDIHPWVRINRIIRDIPNEYIEAGNTNTSMRQDLNDELKKLGKTSMDIRFREIKNTIINSFDIELVERNYIASDGQEFFLSFESKDRKYILGFLRLRLSQNAGSIFNELQHCALIRELHIYGQLIKVEDINNYEIQHQGYGKQLLIKAEQISKLYNFNKIAVISGNGVKNYYRKFNYIDHDFFLIKNI